MFEPKTNKENKMQTATAACSLTATVAQKTEKEEGKGWPINKQKEKTRRDASTRNTHTAHATPHTTLWRNEISLVQLMQQRK